MTLHEPVVTLTDYLLTLECGLFAVLLARSGSGGMATVCFAFVIFFSAAASASLFGGTVHGFFPDATSTGNRALWTTTMLSVGLTALAALVAGARLGASRGLAAKLTPIFTFLYVIYAVVVIFSWREFIVTVYFYVPATMFLLGVFVWLWTTAHNPGAPWGRVRATSDLRGRRCADRAGLLAPHVPQPQRAPSPDPGHRHVSIVPRCFIGG